MKLHPKTLSSIPDVHLSSLFSFLHIKPYCPNYPRMKISIDHSSLISQNVCMKRFQKGCTSILHLPYVTRSKLRPSLATLHLGHVVSGFNGMKNIGFIFEKEGFEPRLKIKKRNYGYTILEQSRSNMPLGDRDYLLRFISIALHSNVPSHDLNK